MEDVCTTSCLLLDFLIAIICCGCIWRRGGVVRFTAVNHSTALLMIDKMFGSGEELCGVLRNVQISLVE